MCSVIVAAYFCQFEASKIVEGERERLGSFNLVDNYCTETETLFKRGKRRMIKSKYIFENKLSSSLRHISFLMVFTAN